ncbi:MAG: hypothetical protein JRG81_00185 [Deltaproteobacteria bacterium]|nr:hypothetical protein [Deltaproteobacteria bacterium]MBW2363495.1 hypothetical protein [Deltaproteobacteria bacterium]
MNEDNLIPYNDTLVLNQRRGPRKWQFFAIPQKMAVSERPIIIRENDGCPTGERLESLNGCYGGMSDVIWDTYKNVFPREYQALLNDPSIELIFIKGGVLFKRTERNEKRNKRT